MPKARDLTNQTFNQLTGIQFVGCKRFANRSRRMWLFQCSCGTQKVLAAQKVTKGDTKSCGCLRGTYSGLESLAYCAFSEGSSSYADGDLTFEQFLALSQQPCFYCGAPPSNVRRSRGKGNHIFTYNGLDRLDNSQPHNLSNCVPCCFVCNSKKSNWNFPQFMNWISTIYHKLLTQENPCQKP